MEHAKISVRQFTVLVMLYTIGTTILIIPSGLAEDAKQDAWIAAVLGVGFSALLALLYNKVGKLFPDETLVQYNEKLLGKWAGKAASLLFVFFSFIGAATLLFYVGNFVSTQIMPETPIASVNLLFAGLVVMGLRLRLETLARAAEILFPWFVLLFCALLAFVAPQVKLHNIQPVMEIGIKPLLKAAISVAGTAALPLIVFFMIFPSLVNHPERARKAFLIATSLGGLSIILITFLAVSVLGADTTARQLYPSYILAKKISVGDFVERIESIAAGMWIISIYFKLTLYFYACVTGFAQTMNLKDYRPLVYPFGMILVVYSLIVYPDINYMAEWDSTVFIPYVMTFGLAMPLLLLAVAGIKRMLRS